MKKVLVCDDAEEILEVINIILTDSGYEVKIISECKNIVEDVKAFKPDIILLDLWIHNDDGRDIANRIRAEKEVAQIPILFISALNELDKITEESNVNGFIKKPFELEDLLSKVGETISANEVNQSDQTGSK